MKKTKRGCLTWSFTRMEVSRTTVKYWANHIPRKRCGSLRKARAHKQSLERDIGLRNERLAQLKEEATQLEPVKQSDIDAFISLNQQENEIKNKEFELTAIEKDIANKQRDKDELQANIGWSETHHDVDSSEAMKVMSVSKSRINKNKRHTLSN